MPVRVAIFLVFAACAHRVPLYCDENTPCQDPERPFCDLEGAFPASEGIGKTCIPSPFDAGPADATVADAAAPCTPREWAPEFVDQEGDIGFAVDIAVDRDLGVHIVYQRDIDVARYAYRPAGSASWDVRTLEAGGFYVQVVTAGDRVDVVHGTLSTLRHLTRSLTESGFAGQNVASVVAYDVSLAADPQGVLHVAYFNSSEAGKSPSYQRTDGNNWLLPEIVVPGGQGIANAIGVSNGVVHLAFELATPTPGLKYARRSIDGEWSVVPVESSDGTDAYSGLAADDAGAHIAYLFNGEMRYALARATGGFERDTVEQVGESFAFMGTAIDADGGIHLTYRDALGGRLRYAYREASSGSFLAETIESGPVGTVSAAAVDVSGGVHVAYIDDGGKDVKYAYLCR